MNLREERLFLCNKHPEAPAESRCKDCDEYLCVDCSIDHNPHHKVVILRQEAMQFARSVINRTFTPTEEESSSRVVLDKLVELTRSHEELQQTLRQARLRLGNLGADLSHELESLHAKANAITEDLAILKDTNCNRLCDEIKEFMNRRDYFSVYKKKEEFAKIVANRSALDGTRIDKLIKQIRKHKKALSKLLSSLSLPSEEVIDSESEQAPSHRVVGRLEGTVLLYDLVTRRRQTVRPKNARLHECCEGVEARGCVYITGGKDDDRDTYELSLDDCARGELVVKAEMTQGRCNHAMCQMKDSVVYCAGGVYDKTTLNKCEKYDIDRDEWEEISPLSEAKHNGSMCVLADRYVFFVGGGKIGHSCLFATIEVLDTTAGDSGWEIVPLDAHKSKWVPCECVNSVAISKTEIIIFGGWEKDKDSRASCFIYNHENRTVSKSPSKLRRNSAFFYRIAPVTYSGRIYAMGPDENIHSFFIKDREWDILEANDWKDQIALSSRGPLMLTGRILHTLWVYEVGQGYGHSFNPKNHKFVDCSEGVVVGGVIYIVGGENDSKATVAIDICNYRREVTRKAELNVGRYNHAVEAVDERLIYCCGGCAGRDMLNHCEKYSVEKDRWVVIPRLNEAKQNITLCALGCAALFCFGGGLIGHESLFATAERLDLRDEEAGWQLLNVSPASHWRPLECVGSVQLNPYEILLFGGWKPNRDESGKCFIYNSVQNEVTMQRAKLLGKTGFYYALRPHNDNKKVYAMDPGFNVNIYDVREKRWDILRKEDWKEEDKKEDDRCLIF